MDRYFSVLIVTFYDLPLAGGWMCAGSQGVKTGENRPAVRGLPARRERSARSIVTLRSQSQSDAAPAQTWHSSGSGDLHAQYTQYNRTNRTKYHKMSSKL